MKNDFLAATILLACLFVAPLSYAADSSLPLVATVINKTTQYAAVLDESLTQKVDQQGLSGPSSTLQLGGEMGFTVDKNAVGNTEAMIGYNIVKIDDFRTVLGYCQFQMNIVSSSSSPRKIASVGSSCTTNAVKVSGRMINDYNAEFVIENN
jgi:hypothetical protein